MKYYHVRIYTQQDPDNKWEWVQDLSREKLENLIIVPYRVGRHITINGRTVRVEDLRRITLEQTDGPWETTHDASTDVTNEFITSSPGSDTGTGAAAVSDCRPLPGARKVFVVHGRNELAREALYSFLRSIGLDPLEWSAAVQATGTSTPYIGDILNAAFSHAHAVIVLFTPDDEACLKQQFRHDNDLPHELEPTGQARPNVLFEAGMAIGRDFRRTILVEVGTVRPFSDIGGLHILRIDDTSQRRQQLAQRLATAGCPVKLDGVDWHTAGDFAAALKLAQASLDSAATITNGAARRDTETSSDYRRIAHRDSKVVAESIHEREDQAFINAVTDFDDS